MSLRNLAALFQQIGFEEFADKVQTNYPVWHSELLRVMCSERNLPVIVLRPVVEADSPYDVVSQVSFIECGHSIHPAAEQDDNLLLVFHGIEFSTLCFLWLGISSSDGNAASTVTLIPPLAANFP